MKQHTLPSKPSELLSLALSDLEKCENDPTYVIDMSDWHKPNPTGQCMVCLAGSVMAQSLNCSPLQELYPGYFAYTVYDQLAAINWFRIGLLQEGLRALKIKNDNIPADFEITTYEVDPIRFKKRIKDVITMFQVNGL